VPRPQNQYLKLNRPTKGAQIRFMPDHTMEVKSSNKSGSISDVYWGYAQGARYVCIVLIAEKSHDGHFLRL
jgi:hypothetical protein